MSTVGEIRDEVIKMLGNTLSQAGHPFRSPTDYTYLWITRAANKIPRLAAAGGYDILSTFEELFAQWQGQTANGIAYIDPPVTALIVRQFDSFDALAADANVDKLRLVPKVTPFEFDRSRTGSESAAYPQRWTRKGKRLYYGPVADATHETDVLLSGIKKDALYNDVAQSPTLKEDWHEAITFEAAAIGANAMGYWERAREFRAQAVLLVQTGTQVPVQEDLMDGETFDLGDLPDAWEIYS